jgi:signal recognition particle receptor subunit beta
MALINTKKKEVQIKIVYYGPGRGGKTTNLEHIYANHNHRIHSEMISLKTQGDRTLFFDFLPFDLGNVCGYAVKIQLYTVPGQVKYDATRKLVLKGVDGIVFVADATKEMRQKNMYALKNLQTNLKEHRKSIFKIPLVLQYNKMDLAHQSVPMLTKETLEHDLNRKLKVPSYCASAINGENVLVTMKKAISLTLSSLESNFI